MSTTTKSIPVQISCATNAELLTMRNKASYTEYYRRLIEDELRRRITNKLRYDASIT